jgi:hypothetical protein
VRIPAHIPGVCGTRSNSTICTETNFLQIEGVCDGASQLRLCGGTAVSCRVSIFTWASRTCERETRAERPLALGLVYLSHTDISCAPLALRVRAQGADVRLLKLRHNWRYYGHQQLNHERGLLSRFLNAPRKRISLQSAHPHRLPISPTSRRAYRQCTNRR